MDNSVIVMVFYSTGIDDPSQNMVSVTKSYYDQHIVPQMHAHGLDQEMVYYDLRSDHYSTLRGVLCGMANNFIHTHNDHRIDTLKRSRVISTIFFEYPREVLLDLEENEEYL